MVRAMCGVQLKDRKRSLDLTFILNLNETINLFAMANSVRWHVNVLRRDDCNVLIMALDFFRLKVKGRKGGEWGQVKRTWKKLVEEESVKVGLRREDALCRSKWRVGIDQIAAGLR